MKDISSDLLHIEEKIRILMNEMKTLPELQEVLSQPYHVCSCNRVPSQVKTSGDIYRDDELMTKIPYSLLTEYLLYMLADTDMFSGTVGKTIGELLLLFLEKDKMLVK